MPLIVLWDIDHTLIENNGVSKQIYADAFRRLTGQPSAHRARTEGRTDRLICRQMFLDHGLEPPTWDVIGPALEAAGAGLEAELARRGEVLPGVRDVLTLAAAERNFVSSVLTGNIAANAMVKLRALGLDHLLDLECGAYGEHSEDRGALVEVARKRVHQQHALPLTTPVVLIGDTPRDVQAAHDTGAHVVAVATGVDSAEALRMAGARMVLSDLRESSRLIDHLRSLAL
ncbi:haloacid dehalogenase-like hydrolase [Kineosporia sp. J2-2]|uniref:Haloacid dehalogenase-like hydrolase n=1 Tax=Kineosporia corallincola TaxID=2835133 RepID=A0ABS5TTM4_9ACTN|nr:haloacid dehalogenase-like hydrolase [Kineosporia corallincola]MBT0774148.1 haloacid dehalogenase-like hydrolase [Kineosporia corallincola]